MASLFRRWHTVPHPDGTLERRQSRVWSGKWRDADGVPQRRALSRNKEAAVIMLAELVRQAELGSVGLGDPYAEHRRRPLLEHLEDFRKYLEAGGCTGKQVSLKTSRIRRLVQGCGFGRTGDLSGSRVQQYLASLRQGPVGCPPPGQELFTLAEAAQVLGVKKNSVVAMAGRGLLASTGRGRQRRIPRAALEAVLARRAAGTGPQTVAYYLREIKSFCRWLVRERRMAENPLSHLEAPRAAPDVRRARRSLDLAELGRLVAAAEASARIFRGMTGPDRAVIYATAAGTGFREGELARLVPSLFQLDTEPPLVQLPARTDKARKPVSQPLPPDLVALLRSYLAGRPPAEPVWPGTWAAKGAEMLRPDLEAAGIAYVTERPDGPLYADFHSLRHSFVLRLDEAGLSLKVAMQLARHSDPKLTMARYGRAGLRQLGEEVARLAPLPPIPSDPPGPASEK